MQVLKDSQNISKINPSVYRRSLSGPFIYTFGPFHLDENERILLRDGKPVPLTPKVFDTLLMLVKGAHHLVTKESLIAALWADTFVDEANLTVNIANVRKALGEKASGQRYVETVPKRGYRFVANVRIVASDRGATTESEFETAVTPRQQQNIGKDNSFKSLAVLPFYNESADPNAEFLSDGLAESIINRLSAIRSLRLVARNTAFRYKAKQIDLQAIGKELSVSYVLSGRMIPLGDRLIIKTELVDVVNGWQVWGDQFHAKLVDILTIQKEISVAICSEINVQLTREERERLGKRYTASTEGYRNYLKGRYHWNKFDQASLKKALEYFKRAIDADPAYALAYTGLADTYYRLSNVYAPTREGMPKAKAAAVKALEIDDSLSEAHAALGLIKMCYDWDWFGAEQELARAIEINPNNAIAHHRYALCVNLQGRFDEAKEHLELAFAVDPLSPQTYWSFALFFFLQRKHQEATGEIQKALDLVANYQPALYLLGRVQIELGNTKEAIAIFRELLKLNDAPMFLASLGYAYAIGKRAAEARKVLSDLRSQSKQRYVSAYHKGMIHFALGNKCDVFSYLEIAYEERCETMTWLKVDPAFDGIRTHLRFENLMRKVGFDCECPVLRNTSAS